MTSENFTNIEELVCPRPPRFKYLYLINTGQELYKIHMLK